MVSTSKMTWLTYLKHGITPENDLPNNELLVAVKDLMLLDPITEADSAKQLKPLLLRNVSNVLPSN